MSGEIGSLLKALMATALLDRDLSADAAVFSLRDLTQVAALLRPERTMTIESAELLTPIEQASIASVAPGRVCFETSSSAR